MGIFKKLKYFVGPYSLDINFSAIISLTFFVRMSH
jgi:hypothetical protein